VVLLSSEVGTFPTHVWTSSPYADTCLHRYDAEKVAALVEEELNVWCCLLHTVTAGAQHFPRWLCCQTLYSTAGSRQARYITIQRPRASI